MQCILAMVRVLLREERQRAKQVAASNESVPVLFSIPVVRTGDEEEEGGAGAGAGAGAAGGAGVDAGPDSRSPAAGEEDTAEGG